MARVDPNAVENSRRENGMLNFKTGPVSPEIHLVRREPYFSSPTAEWIDWTEKKAK